MGVLLYCLRCGSDWVSRKKPESGVVLKCPRCQSRKWNVPREEVKQENEGVGVNVL